MCAVLGTMCSRFCVPDTKYNIPDIIWNINPRVAVLVEYEEILDAQQILARARGGDMNANNEGATSDSPRSPPAVADEIFGSHVHPFKLFDDGWRYSCNSAWFGET